MGDRFETGRIEAFSDGIFAIAITLLVLDIGVPDDAFDDLWRGLADQWPSYLAYATSFWTIGGLWAVHHAVFRRLRYADHVLMRVNLLLLLIVAFLPFPTSVIGEAVGTDTSEREAVLFYGATLFVTSVIVTGMCDYAASRRELLPGGDAAATLRGVAARTRPTPAFYVLVLLLAVLAPRVAAFGFLAVALATVLVPGRGRGIERRHT
jgi:TMEM175 potassium channel family protein